MLTPQTTASVKAIAVLLSLQTLNLISTTSAVFVYPPSKWKTVADKYKDGDSANVTWDSAYGDPYLQLFCGQFPPLTNQSVDTNGSKSVFFQTGKRDNCYFRLSDHLSYIASANFSIADDSGPAKSWNFSANAKPSSTGQATATSQRVTVTADPVPQTSSADASPTTTATSSSSSTSTPTSTAAGGLSTGAKIGLGVGIPVGVLAIAGIAGALWFFLRRKRSHKYEKGDAAVGAFNNNGKAELDTSLGIEAPRPSNVSKHGSTHDLADGPRLEQYELENRPVQQASHFELDAQSPSVATGGGGGLAPTMGQHSPYRDTPRPHSNRISGLYD